jgi:DNA polymerase-3 subunit gamma/tau
MADSTAHLVLARKWRPERFSELVGQEHVTRTLSEALKRGRIAHAFLFTGIRGVGKTTAARILARCLNCEKGPTAEPCGECAACVEIRAGRALDVSEIDGATYRKIDDARAIIENLSYRPARDRFKIYIIDEAHQLTDQAFNALLKTLEEPPPHVKFVLATTEPQKMPETILSRLQRYDFRRIPYATILERLKDLARREEVEVEEAALRLLAREAGGSMRDAERMLETAIATASVGSVTEAEVASSLGVASRTTVLKITDAIVEKNAAEALKNVRELANRGANLESLGRDILETLRNLAIAKLPAGDSQSPLDDIPDHEVAELKRLAERASSRDIMRLFCRRPTASRCRRGQGRCSAARPAGERQLRSRPSRIARFHPRPPRCPGRLHGTGRRSFARRRFDHAYRAQRHLCSISQRQQVCDRAACNRAFRPRDSRRTLDQRPGIRLDGSGEPTRTNRAAYVQWPHG